MTYTPTIGLEIHSELDTKSKMFCASKNDPDEEHPNINICPVCMGHPGTLPVMNKRAVEYVALVGLALGGTVNEYAQFDRKNYFYPDLPKGYQISQYKHPIVSGGSITLTNGKVVKITRVHLEEDTGRLAHDNQGNTLVDFNRAGVPLMELVTEPDMHSAEEAREFAEELQLVLRYVGASHARMEKSEMRVEANVSLSKDETLGTKVEVKNLNSFRSVERAIEFEVVRQSAAYGTGEKVMQETRGWDEVKGVTVSQRSKESAHDYRYFPEPDLPPVRFNTVGGISISELKKKLPELPQQKRNRLMSEYDFDRGSAQVLVRDQKMANYAEAAFSEFVAWCEVNKTDEAAMVKGKKLLRNYLLSDVAGLVTEKLLNWNEILLTPENFAETISMIVEGNLSSRGAKDLLRALVESGGDPHDHIERLGLKQSDDSELILAAIERVKQEQVKAYADFKNGNENTLQFLIGMTMKAVKESGASANPEKVKELWTSEIK